MKRVRPALAGAACVALAAVVYLSDDTFLMVSGSDSASFVVGPPAAVQIAEAAVFAACLLLPATAPARAGLLVVAAAASLLAAHRLVIDNLHGEIRDVYLMTQVQVLPLDQGLEGGLSSRTDIFGFRIGQESADRSMRVLSPPFLGLDREALERITS